MTDDLIKRLEAAEEGSRELDGDIALILDAPRHFFESKGVSFDPTALQVDGPDCFGGKPIWGGGGHLWEAPQYTTSIDAALTLVLEDERNEITGLYDWWLESTNAGLTISARVGADRSNLSFADTPALALCIAALKARKAATNDAG